MTHRPRHPPRPVEPSRRRYGQHGGQAGPWQRSASRRSAGLRAAPGAPRPRMEPSPDAVEQVRARSPSSSAGPRPSRRRRPRASRRRRGATAPVLAGSPLAAVSHAATPAALWRALRGGPCPRRDATSSPPAPRHRHRPGRGARPPSGPRPAPPWPTPSSRPTDPSTRLTSVCLPQAARRRAMPARRPARPDGAGLPSRDDPPGSSDRRPDADTATERGAGSVDRTAHHGPAGHGPLAHATGLRLRGHRREDLGAGPHRTVALLHRPSHRGARGLRRPAARRPGPRRAPTLVERAGRGDRSAAAWQWRARR